MIINYKKVNRFSSFSSDSLFLLFYPPLTFSAPPPYPLISWPFYGATEMWLLQNGQLTGRPRDRPKICVCVSTCDFKRVTALVCQRELASIFLSLLCIVLSDLSASTAHISKKHFQDRGIKREKVRGGWSKEGKGEEKSGRGRRRCNELNTTEGLRFGSWVKELKWTKG